MRNFDVLNVNTKIFWCKSTHKKTPQNFWSDLGKIWEGFGKLIPSKGLFYLILHPDSMLFAYILNRFLYPYC